MFRSDDEMADRDVACQAIKKAFDRAGVGTRHQRMTGMPYSEVAAWLNYGGRRQRRLCALVDDDGSVRVFLSRLYLVPLGKSGDDMLSGEQIPVLFRLPSTTKNLGDTIVQRVGDVLEKEWADLRGAMSSQAVRTKDSENFHLPSVVHFLRAAEVFRRSTGVLSLQTLVVPGPHVNDGIIVEAVTAPWIEIVKHLERDPNFLHSVPWRKLEEVIAGAYKKAGFDEVVLTSASDDKGRDVIAVKRGFVQVRVLDQVKAYKPGHLVDANDVRALLGVLSGDQNASKGVVTTSSDFAPRTVDDPFIKPFIPYRLELVNGLELIRRLSRLVEKDQSSPYSPFSPFA
jgi:restriction system protein